MKIHVSGPDDKAAVMFIPPGGELTALPGGDHDVADAVGVALCRSGAATPKTKADQKILDAAMHAADDELALAGESDNSEEGDAQ